MRLGINGWRHTSRRTGVGRYIRYLVRAWDEHSSARFSEMTVYTPRPLDADDDAAVSPAIHRRVLAPDARMLVWENVVHYWGSPRSGSASSPVMEAQATGLPVICFRHAGMLEITGGSAVLLDRLTPQSLCEAMVAVAEDAALCRQLREGGLASAARFS